MYCYECGAELVDGVCPNNCQPHVEAERVFVRPSIDEYKKQKAEVFSIVALIAGILSIAGYGLVYGIVSIIFSNLYFNRVGEYNDMAKIGKNLGIAGIIVSAALTVLIITIYICLYAGIIVMGGLYA